MNQEITEECYPSPESLKEPSYSSIIIIPYTSRIAGIAENKIIPDREARIRLSSYSAMVTAVAEMLYKEGVAPHIVALGENTFGQEHPSTADLMKQQLVKRGVPENAITVIGNLQDTDVQIGAVKTLDENLVKNPLYIIMEHHKRVRMIITQKQLPGEVMTAEDFLTKRFEEKHAHLEKENPEEYKHLLEAYKKKLNKFVPLKYRTVESLYTIAARFGSLGTALIEISRRVRGGTTITDYHTLGTAKSQLERAKSGIRNGQLKPSPNKGVGITSEEAHS